MFCENCGNEIKDGDKFCKVCGNSVEQTADTVANSTDVKKQKSKVGIVIVIILILLMLIGGAIAIAIFVLPSLDLEQDDEDESKKSSKKNKKEADDEDEFVPVLDLSDVQVGDVVCFGTYNYGNGEEVVEWDVLEVQDDKVLIISHCVLNEYKYHNSYSDEIHWADSDIRAYMNDTLFYDMFSEEEQAQIIKTTITNPSSVDFYEKYYPERPFWGNTNSSKDTKDKLFLLSFEELEEYYSVIVDDEDRWAYAYDAVADNPYPQYKMKGGDAWWLRSNGYNDDTAMVVDGFGRIDATNLIGYIKTSPHIRPAMWVER